MHIDDETLADVQCESKPVGAVELFSDEQEVGGAGIMEVLMRGLVDPVISW